MRRLYGHTFDFYNDTSRGSGVYSWHVPAGIPFGGRRYLAGIVPNAFRRHRQDFKIRDKNFFIF